MTQATQAVSKRPALTHTAVVERIKPVLFAIAAWTVMTGLASGTFLQPPVDFAMGLGCTIYMANHLAKCWQRDKQLTGKVSFYVYAAIAFFFWPLAVMYEMAIAGWGMFNATPPEGWWQVLIWTAVKISIGFVLFCIALWMFAMISASQDDRYRYYDYFDGSWK